MNNESIARVKSYKFLGIIIDEKLKWAEHKSYVSKKIIRNIGILYKTRDILSKEDLITQYNSFILPYLLYCLPVWGGTVLSKRDPIIKSQNRVLRVMAHKVRTIPAIQDLKDSVFDIKSLYQIELCMQVHDFFNNKLPTPNMELFKNEICTRTTRNTDQNKFISKLGKTKRQRTSFIYNSVETWNALPREYKVIEYKNKFSESIKTHYRNHNFNEYLNVNLNKCDNISIP